MVRRTTGVRAVGGGLFLAGALALAACGSSTATGNTSTNTSTNSQQQSVATILQHVQMEAQQGKLKNANVTSTNTVQTNQGSVTSDSKGTLALNPFALDWTTTSTLAGQQITSKEIIAHNNLYYKTSNSAQWNQVSLSQAASQLNGSSNTSTSTNTSTTSGTGSTTPQANANAIPLQNFLNVTNAHLVCGSGTSGTSTSNTGSNCTSMLNVNGHSVKVYHIVGQDMTSTSGSASASGTSTTNTSTTQQSVSSTENLYVSAANNNSGYQIYQPVEVQFMTQSTQGTINSTTMFSNWNSMSTPITPPPASQVK